ncbi:hypothetical protein LSAT2_004773 [Lamellibrachia satsuma]|nr:hypothetical protein LSAT2_004773 [Lamellibrachia satsuma]
MPVPLKVFKLVGPRYLTGAQLWLPSAAVFGVTGHTLRKVVAWHSIRWTDSSRTYESMHRRADTMHLYGAKHKSSAKKRRKVLRAKRKGFQDKKEQEEGNSYESGAHA